MRWRSGSSKSGDSGPGPDEALASKQARALVLAALERIPLPRRAVLVMHDIDDVPVSEVAAMLAIPLFTVYSRLRKARRELEAAIRRMLKEAERPMSRSSETLSTRGPRAARHEREIPALSATARARAIARARAALVAGVAARRARARSPYAAGRPRPR